MEDTFLSYGMWKSLRSNLNNNVACSHLQPGLQGQLQGSQVNSRTTKLPLNSQLAPHSTNLPNDVQDKAAVTLYQTGESGPGAGTLFERPVRISQWTGLFSRPSILSDPFPLGWNSPGTLFFCDGHKCNKSVCSFSKRASPILRCPLDRNKPPQGFSGKRNLHAQLAGSWKVEQWQRPDKNSSTLNAVHFHCLLCSSTFPAAAHKLEDTLTKGRTLLLLAALPRPVP